MRSAGRVFETPELGYWVPEICRWTNTFIGLWGSPKVLVSCPLG